MDGRSCCVTTSTHAMSTYTGILSDDLGEHAGVHVVDEPADQVLVPEVHRVPYPVHRRPHAVLDLTEGLDRPGRPQPAGLLQLVLEAVLGDLLESAVGVLDD